MRLVVPNLVVAVVAQARRTGSAALRHEVARPAPAVGMAKPLVGEAAGTRATEVDRVARVAVPAIVAGQVELVVADTGVRRVARVAAEVAVAQTQAEPAAGKLRLVLRCRASLAAARGYRPYSTVPEWLPRRVTCRLAGLVHRQMPERCSTILWPVDLRLRAPCSMVGDAGSRPGRTPRRTR